MTKKWMAILHRCRNLAAARYQVPEKPSREIGRQKEKSQRAKQSKR
jgi:hypothetical protein